MVFILYVLFRDPKRALENLQTDLEELILSITETKSIVPL